jgi:hypothetical protein
MAIQVGKELRHLCRGQAESVAFDRVVNPVAPLVSVDKPGLPQNPQVLGDRRGSNPEPLGQRPNTQVPAGEVHEDLHPGRVRQCLEDLEQFSHR